MPSSRRTPSRGPSSRGRSGPGRRRAAARAKAAAGAGRETTATRRPRLTGRAAILVLVLAVLMVSYASSLRAYLQQRAHIGDLNAKIAERQASIDDLAAEQQRWKDPAYLEQQARLSKGYVAPGERTFVVLDADGNRVQGDATLQDPATVITQSPTAWWTTAWDSVELAGHPPKVGKPPAATIDGSAEPQGVTGPDAGGVSAADEAAIAAQLGRAPRAIHEVGHRCPCGSPDVVTTEPRLPGGTPFPTTYYLTCPRAASRIGTLEASGLMRQMQDRLADDAELAASYAEAHRRYLAARGELEAAIGGVPEIAGISAGGMPDRVKCLHVLAGQSLAQGRGVNPLGDEVLDLLGEWWAAGPCVVDGERSGG